MTAGPTREPIDPVRVVSNRSSGKMGYRVAEVAWERGADVVLISGPTALPAPSRGHAALHGFDPRARGRRARRAAHRRRVGDGCCAG